MNSTALNLKTRAECARTYTRIIKSNELLTGGSQAEFIASLLLACVDVLDGKTTQETSAWVARAMEQFK